MTADSSFALWFEPSLCWSCWIWLGENYPYT